MSPHFRLRKITAYPDWHRQPFLLNRAEMANPYPVLTEFFDRYDLSNIRVVLKQWLEDAVDGTEEEAASHLYAHENIARLVEAAWVIQGRTKQSKADEGFDIIGMPDRDESDAQEEDDQTEKPRFVKWVTFPASLRAAPLLYLQQVFEVMEVDGLEDVVNRWQRIALAADYGRYETAGERADLLDFCEGFLRLIEAAYVLKRSAEWDAEGRTRWPLSEAIKHDLLTEKRPFRLSEKEINNPDSVITNFFQTFSPAYARRELWDMLGCAVEYKGEELKRLDLLMDYECLHALLEAAWLLYGQTAATGQANEENKPKDA